MKNAIFDGNISLEYPDDFYEMDEAEISKFFAGDMLRFGARNKEKQVILSLGKTNKSFMNLLASPKSVLAGAENNFKNNLKDYKLLEEFAVDMLDKAGCGIRFSYSAIDKDVKQFCEMVVVKAKGVFYISYCLARLDDQKENEEVFKAFRNSLKLA